MELLTKQASGNDTPWSPTPHLTPTLTHSCSQQSCISIRRPSAPPHTSAGNFIPCLSFQDVSTFPAPRQRARHLKRAPDISLYSISCQYSEGFRREDTDRPASLSQNCHTSVPVGMGRAVWNAWNLHSDIIGSPFFGRLRAPTKGEHPWRNQGPSGRNPRCIHKKMNMPFEWGKLTWCLGISNQYAAHIFSFVSSRSRLISVIEAQLYLFIFLRIRLLIKIIVTIANSLSNGSYKLHDCR